MTCKISHVFQVSHLSCSTWEPNLLFSNPLEESSYKIFPLLSHKSIQGDWNISSSHQALSIGSLCPIWPPHLKWNATKIDILGSLSEGTMWPPSHIPTKMGFLLYLVYL
jgi:hypothetical protein